MFAMILDRIRAHNRRKRLERQQSAIAAHASYLDAVYRRRFPGTNKVRFELLWCEIAEVCRVTPGELHEDDKIADRCPPSNDLFSSDNRLDDLEYIILTESRNAAPPKQRPETIGQVLDYLLQANRGADGD